MNPAEPSTTDLYEILQVSPSASPEVIEAAYNGLSKKFGADADPAVRERRRGLDEAYGVLSNDAKRADYDRARKGPVSPPGPPPAATVGPATGPGASSDAPVYPRTGVVACPRDPEVQTGLRCSRCENPICPKCLIQTPVGARCRDCARISRSPVYTMTNATMARAAVAAIVGGVVMGLIWAVVLQPFSYGFLSIFLGAGLGYAFTRMMEFATGRKRGPAVVGFAIGGIAIAWGMQLLFLPFEIALYGLVAVGVACYFAYQNLR